MGSGGETTKNDGQPMEIVGIAAPIRDDLFDREIKTRFAITVDRKKTGPCVGRGADCTEDKLTTRRKLSWSRRRWPMACRKAAG